MTLHRVGWIEMGTDEVEECPDGWDDDWWYAWDLTNGINLNPATGAAGDLIQDFTPGTGLYAGGGNRFFYKTFLSLPNCAGRTIAIRISAGVPGTPLAEMSSWVEGLPFNFSGNFNYTTTIQEAGITAFAFEHSPTYLSFDQGSSHVHDWGNVFRSVTAGQAFGRQWSPDITASDYTNGFPGDPVTPITTGLIVLTEPNVAGSFSVSFGVQVNGDSASALPSDLFLSAGVFAGVLSPAEVAARGV